MDHPGTSDSPPPWSGLTNSHGVNVDVDGPSVVIDVGGEWGGECYLAFDEAMAFREVLDRAIARAVWNAKRKPSRRGREL